MPHSQNLKASQTMDLSKKEIIEYLQSDGEELFQLADGVRKENVGSEVHLRGLIEFSNHCKQNCLYCGIRRDNSSCKRYRLSEEEIITTAKEAVKEGFKTIVLQSGEDDGFTLEKMKRIIKEIKSLDTALTLSSGEKSLKTYEEYKHAGLDRFLLRIETTDKELYRKMHPDMSFENRLKSLERLKTAGLEVGTGCLVGLPGQTTESLAEDILFFKEINADMIGIGPFIPNPNTPLSDVPAGSLKLALKVMALTRLVLPKSNIPATTAMEALNKNGRIIALRSGANVIMPNLTDYNFKKAYELYPNKPLTKDSIKAQRQKLSEMLAKIGRTISIDYGSRA